MLLVSGWIFTRATEVPDFAYIRDVREKKAQFFAYLTPVVEDVNKDIEADKALLRRLGPPSSDSWLNRVRYHRLRALYMDPEQPIVDDSARYQALRNRIDTLPISLVLIQAAKESGWGTSRFARQGYNFFGQQCFVAGCGFTPRQRDSGRRHEVARFTSPRQSVRAYMHNLNTHPRYEKLRQIRADLRDQGQPITGTALADGLTAYSERGQIYVEELKAMITASKLE
jgi:Bax protein